MRVDLSERVQLALMKLAADERRDTRRQAEAIIEAELVRRGLLSDATSDAAPSRASSATGAQR